MSSFYNKLHGIIYIILLQKILFASKLYFEETGCTILPTITLTDHPNDLKIYENTEYTCARGDIKLYDKVFCGLDGPGYYNDNVKVNNPHPAGCIKVRCPANLCQNPESDNCSGQGTEMFMLSWDKHSVQKKQKNFPCSSGGIVLKVTKTDNSNCSFFVTGDSNTETFTHQCYHPLNNTISGVCNADNTISKSGYYFSYVLKKNIKQRPREKLKMSCTKKAKIKIHKKCEFTTESNAKFEPLCGVDDQDCTMECDENYRINNELTLKGSCHSLSSSKCSLVIDCAIDNGELARCLNGDNCPWSCNHGYTNSNDPGNGGFSDCNYNGTLSPNPQCIQLFCQPPNPTENYALTGECNIPDIEIDTVCGYTCTSTYYKDSTQDLTCSEVNGVSNFRPEPSCKSILCRIDLLSGDSDVYDLPNWLENTNCAKISDAKLIMLESSCDITTLAQYWVTNKRLTCNDIQQTLRIYKNCKLPFTENPGIKPGDSQIIEKTFTNNGCASNYDHNTHSFTVTHGCETRLNNGFGMSDATTLTKIDCSDLVSKTINIIDCHNSVRITNGSIVGECNIFEDCVYQCDDGHILSSNTKINCYPSEVYVCERSACEFENTHNLNLVGSCKYNDNCNWKCNAGYRATSLERSGISRCQSDGELNPPIPQCNKVFCDVSSPGAEFTVNQDCVSGELGSQCGYDCNQNYYKTETGLMTCTDTNKTGILEFIGHDCKLIHCRIPIINEKKLEMIPYDITLSDNCRIEGEEIIIYSDDKKCTIAKSTNFLPDKTVLECDHDNAVKLTQLCRVSFDKKIAESAQIFTNSRCIESYSDKTFVVKHGCSTQLKPDFTINGKIITEIECDKIQNQKIKIKDCSSVFIPNGRILSECNALEACKIECLDNYVIKNNVSGPTYCASIAAECVPKVCSIGTVTNVRYDNGCNSVGCAWTCDDGFRQKFGKVYAKKGNSVCSTEGVLTKNSVCQKIFCPNDLRDKSINIILDKSTDQSSGISLGQSVKYECRTKYFKPNNAPDKITCAEHSDIENSSFLKYMPEKVCISKICTISVKMGTVGSIPEKFTATPDNEKNCELSSNKQEIVMLENECTITLPNNFWTEKNNLNCDQTEIIIIRICQLAFAEKWNVDNVLTNKTCMVSFDQTSLNITLKNGCKTGLKKGFKFQKGGSGWSEVNCVNDAGKKIIKPGRKDNSLLIGLLVGGGLLATGGVVASGVYVHKKKKLGFKANETTLIITDNNADDEIIRID